MRRLLIEIEIRGAGILWPSHGGPVDLGSGRKVRQCTPPDFSNVCKRFQQRCEWCLSIHVGVAARSFLQANNAFSGRVGVPIGRVGTKVHEQVDGGGCGWEPTQPLEMRQHAFANTCVSRWL